MFRKVILSVCVCFLITTCFAGGNWPFNESKLKPDSRISYGELSNGLRYVFMSNSEPSKRISLRLMVHSGSLMEKEEQRGVAHFMEHMAFNGTKHFPSGEMVTYFQRLGMAFGADTNAHTGFDETVFKLDLPDNNEKLLNDSMTLLRDYADGILFAEKEIEKERGVILNEKRSRDSADFRTMMARMDFLFSDSIISKRMPIGLEKVIKNAKRDSFLNYYQGWYSPDRMIVLCVGDITKEKFLKSLKMNFESIKKAPEIRKNPNLGEIKKIGFRVASHYEKEAADTTINLLCTKPFVKQVDTLDKRLADLNRYAASRMLSRRLDKLAKKENSPIRTGVAYSYDWLDFVRIAGMKLNCRPEQWEDALMLSENELRRVLEYGFTESEVKEIRAVFLNLFEEEVKKEPSKKSRELVDSLLRNLRMNEIYTSAKDDFAWAKKVIKSITPETTLQAFRKLWDTSDLAIFVSGNIDLKNPDKQIKNDYLKFNKQQLTPWCNDKIQKFQYTDCGKPATVVEKKTFAELGIVQVLLSNNVYVTVKKTDFAANKIQIVARFGAGQLITPKLQPGLPLLANSTFTAGGLKKHSVDELVSILAGKSVGTGFKVASDSFMMTGVTSPKDLDLQLQLMTAYFKDPGYRPEALRKAREGFQNAYAQMKNTPIGIFRNQVAKFLAGGDYRFGFPPEKELMALTMKGLAEWLEAPLRHSAMNVGIVGDIDPEKAIAAVAATLGTLPKRDKKSADYEKLRKVEYPAGVKEKVFKYKTEIPKALIGVFWPGVGMEDITLVRRLNILASIFSERLRVKIREDIGGTYSPYAYNVSSDAYSGYGYLSGGCETDPAEAQKLCDAIVDVAATLSEKGTNADEFQRVLKPFIERLKLIVRSNNYWLYSVLCPSVEEPRRLEWAKNMSADFAKISLAEINELAKKYFNPEKTMKIMVLPDAQGKDN